MTGTPSGVATGDPTRAATWEEALDALELGLAETEAMLRASHDHADWAARRPAWQPPAVPLPATLAARTAALLARHREAAEQLTRALTGNRRRQRLAAQLEQGSTSAGAAAALYVDRAV